MREEMLTDDGENYYMGQLEEPDVNYSFDEEGMKLMSGPEQIVFGSISWRELEDAGGGTAIVPSNMFISVNSDKNIVLGFDDSGVQIEGMQLTYVNGYPEIVGEHLTIRKSITAEDLKLTGPDGVYRGNNFWVDASGELYISYTSGGTLWELKFSDLVDMAFGS
uniref:hypothetical protein n=1 Tax=Aerococcus urinaeequi TaxID=51665 RepID=UPI00352B65C3